MLLRTHAHMESLSYLLLLRDTRQNSGYYCYDNEREVEAVSAQKALLQALYIPSANRREFQYACNICADVHPLRISNDGSLIEFDFDYPLESSNLEVSECFRSNSLSASSLTELAMFSDSL